MGLRAERRRPNPHVTCPARANQTVGTPRPRARAGEAEGRAEAEVGVMPPAPELGRTPTCVDDGPPAGRVRRGGMTRTEAALVGTEVGGDHGGVEASVPTSI